MRPEAILRWDRQPARKGGQASTVVPISALYPLVTVLAAVFLLKEKVNRIQIGGVALAIAAILLLSEG